MQTKSSVPSVPKFPAAAAMGGSTEVQILFANMLVDEGTSRDAKKALHSFDAEKGLNELAMQSWLHGMSIDANKLCIGSFVHLPLELAQSL